MVFLMELTQMILPILTTGFVGFTVWALQEMRKAKYASIRAGDETTEAVKLAMVTLLRHQLIQAHQRAAETWVIEGTERNNFIEMHEAYKALGGKGVTLELLDDIRKMRVEWKRGARDAQESR